MISKKASFCNFFMFLSVSLLTYILLSGFIDDSYKQENIFLIKLVFLSFLFIILTFFFVFFKFYRNRYLEEEVRQRTNKILTENETLKNHAHIDTLTQVLNKKYFLERFHEEFKRAIREKQNISLIIVNIDEFKAFNDIYGRQEGDECLKLVANILVNHCNRPSDLISRFEGDEFYILLPNTKTPKVVSNKCVKSVNDLNIPHENSIASTVLTISIGVASILPLKLEQKEELILYAKESLKEAKKSGRNRVY